MNEGDIVCKFKVRAAYVGVRDIEVATEVATEIAEMSFEFILQEDCEKKDAEIINGNLTCCLADIPLFAPNFCWISRIKSGKSTHSS